MQFQQTHFSYFFFIINMNIQVNLYISRLILLYPFLILCYVRGILIVLINKNFR